MNRVERTIIEPLEIKADFLWESEFWSLVRNYHHPAVWRIGLEQSVTCLQGLRKILSPEEQARLESYRVELDGRRFLIGRALARMAAAAYWEGDPARISISLGEHGKPGFLQRKETSSLFFNVAHSGDWILLALSQAGEVGVDVEQIRLETDWQAIARRMFSPGENDLLQHADPEIQRRLFFQIWTRREARLKALGTGLSDNQNLPEPDPGETWELKMPEGYVAAVSWGQERMPVR
jgi:4'-phosphopantetheinyl transferase